MPRALACAIVVASGSNVAGCDARSVARGSSSLAKYASPRPRTCTSSVLKPLAEAERTIEAIA
jgi:hypothetical protein